MGQTSDRALPVAQTTPDGGEGRQIARRALIAAAGMGVVGVIAAESPAILNEARKLTEQEIQNAINLGRQQLAQELANLEGIGIDTAIEAANITHGAVQLFVVPIANLLAGLTEITLGVAITAVEKAQQFTSLLHIDIQALQNLDGILHQWQANVASFPAVVSAINNTDTQTAENYLRTLKAKLQQDAVAAPKK